jgi:hypothetical protein
VPVEIVERVRKSYHEKCFDFNVRRFHEQLREEQSIGLSYTWVKQALQGAGLAAEARRSGGAANGARVMAGFRTWVEKRTRQSARNCQSLN